ncbi:MAG: hypothetical protein MUQ48_04315 [Pirellulales bacterium]|nr:hypothetical protein [Pirellulales bacterium]
MPTLRDSFSSAIARSQDIALEKPIMHAMSATPRMHPLRKLPARQLLHVVCIAVIEIYGCLMKDWLGE